VITGQVPNLASDAGQFDDLQGIGQLFELGTESAFPREFFPYFSGKSVRFLPQVQMIQVR
jgi:hypothetical protein